MPILGKEVPALRTIVGALKSRGRLTVLEYRECHVDELNGALLRCQTNDFDICLISLYRCDMIGVERGE